MSINIYHNGELVPVTGGGGSGDGSTVKTTTAATGSGSTVATTIASNTSVDDIAGIVANNSYALNASLAGKQNSADNSLATSDKTVVGAINEVNTGLSNKQDKLTNPLTQSDVVNNLTSTSTNKPLSAAQGKALNDNKQDKLTNPLTQSDVKDNLTSTSTTTPLSANQGRVLNTNLSKKQNSTDNNLHTTSKQIVGAINELNSDLTDKASTTKLERTFTSSDYSLFTVGSNLKITLPFGDITPIDVELKYHSDFAYNDIGPLMYASNGHDLSLMVYNSSSGTWSGNITIRYREG